MIENE
jgi:histone H3/H4